MSALGLASLGVQCQDKALGMSSLGVFCDGVAPPVVERPTGNDYLDAFDRHFIRKEILSELPIRFRDETVVEAFSPTPAVLAVESVLPIVLSADYLVSGAQPRPVALSVESTLPFRFGIQADVDRGIGTPPAPAVEIGPEVGSVSSGLSIALRDETEIAYFAPVVPTLTLASEVRFTVNNATRISGRPGISRDEDDVEVLLLAMQLFRDRD